MIGNGSVCSGWTGKRRTRARCCSTRARRFSTERESPIYRQARASRRRFRDGVCDICTDRGTGANGGFECEGLAVKLTRRQLLVGFVVIVVAVIGGAWFAFAENRQPPFGVTRSG